MTAGKADIVPDFAIRRPNPPDWSAIREILAASNFHRIGGSEMPSFPLQDCFVAERDGRIVGVAGYRVTGARTAQTTLLAVHPAERRHGIGLALHAARQDYLRLRGIRTLYTNVTTKRSSPGTGVISVMSRPGGLSPRPSRSAAPTATPGST